MINRYSNNCCNQDASCDCRKPGDVFLKVEIDSASGVSMDDMPFILKFYVYGNPQFRYFNKCQLKKANGKYYVVLNDNEFASGWLFCDVELLESVENWPDIKRPVHIKCNTGILLGVCCSADCIVPNVGQCGGDGYNVKVTRVDPVIFDPEEEETEEHECCITSEECWAEYFKLPQLVADMAIHDEHGNRIVDTYVTRQAAAAYIRSVFNGMFIENPPLILEGYITPEMLSDAVINMLKANGTSITNLPDGEDLTTIHGVLKFANKRHNAGAYSGLGRQYLRKNLVGGQNLLVQSMMQWPNTIYIVQYDYDLNGETLNIPEGCVLKFEGGSIADGKLTSAGTTLVEGQPVLTSCELQGTFQRIEDGTLLTKVIFI